MALSLSIIWELRPTNGDDTNGGGFKEGASGTDFSQQNSPQQSYTDLVATSTTTATSVARPFTSVDVGNIINITAGTGWTTGRYEITSVTTGTATFDRAIATNGSTGGTGKLGGAMQTYVSFLSNLVMDPIRAYIKAEATITVTTRPDFQHGDNLEITGYTTTRGDGGRVSITTSNGTDNLLLYRGQNSLKLSNIAFSDSSGTRHNGIAFVNPFNYFVLDNCSFDGHSNGVNWNSQGTTHVLLRRTEVKNCTGAGLSIQAASGMVMDGCFIHDNTGNGIDILATATFMHLSIDRSVIRANAIGIKSVDDAGSTNNSAIHIKNSAVISNTSDGVKHQGTGTNNPVITQIENTIVYGNGGFGVNLASTALPKYNYFGANNALGANSSGNYNNCPAQTGDVALSADPFTNAAAADFSLNSTAGGGAACKAAGYPSTFP